MFLLTEQIDKAVEDFDKSVELNPTFPTAYVQKLYTDYRKAALQNDSTQVRNVINKFEEAIDKYPNCIETYALFSQVHMQLTLIVSQIVARIRCSVNWLVCLEELRRHNNIYTIFITVPFQVLSITDKNDPLQSGSVFYERAKLTGAQFKHRVIFTVDGHITVVIQANHSR